MPLGDGLVALEAHLDTRTVADLIAKTARWVDPETFRLLPLWYPEYARGAPLYNANWTVRRQSRNAATSEIRDKVEGNSWANKALTKALGLASAERPNWSCCHIWGIDDPSFVRPNLVVQDHRFFSCVGNMLLLPSPLKAFTDLMPDIKAMLRKCAAALYDWQCDHPELASVAPSAFERADYPEAWQGAAEGRIPGIVSLNADIRRRAEERKAKIAKDISEAGEYYPRDRVMQALDYWRIQL